jgi:hypothetical protein
MKCTVFLRIIFIDIAFSILYQGKAIKFTAFLRIIFIGVISEVIHRHGSSIPALPHESFDWGA